MPLAPRVSRSQRSWNSKDVLPYAVGVGAGAVDPFWELEFTTENSKDVQQKVLPTFAVIIGGGGGGMRNIGTFNPSACCSSTASRPSRPCEPIPPEGKIVSTGEVVGIYDKGSGAVIVSQSESKLAGTDDVLLRTRAWCSSVARAASAAIADQAVRRTSPPSASPITR